MKGWGQKSSVCPSKPRENPTFGGISRDVAGISWRRPKSLRKKHLCLTFVPILQNKISYSERAEKLSELVPLFALPPHLSAMIFRIPRVTLRKPRNSWTAPVTASAIQEHVFPDIWGVRYPKRGFCLEGFCDQVKSDVIDKVRAMKTMKIHRLHRLHRFAFLCALLSNYVEPTRALPDLERVSLAPPLIAHRHEIMAAKLPFCKAPFKGC